MEKSFDYLVSEQMNIMEQLLFLQAELEQCIEIEAEFTTLEQATELEKIQMKIFSLKRELNEIHQIFEAQTEELIHTYQMERIIV